MHPLQLKIAHLHAQVRRLLALYGLSWLVGSVVATALVLGLADYLIHFQDRGIRLMATLAVLGVAGWTAYRFLYQSLVRRLRDVDVAQRVERRFPALNDRLSSSIAFLKQSEDDHEAGSAALRRAVVVDTTDRVEQLDLNQVIERRPARRAMTVAATVLLVAGSVVLADPASAGIALARLARPLADDAWPKLNHLEFRNAPDKVALGQAFEVELVDKSGHTLPPDVRIYYRYEGDGGESQESEPMQLLNTVMVGRKENVTRPFTYWAVGGDGRTEERTLEVVEPPRVESLKITLIPPEYTGWPAATSERHIHALRGTRVEMKVAASTELAAASFHQDSGQTAAARLSEDKLEFTIPADPASPLVIDKTGGYWFELTDLEGLVGGVDSRWEIRAVTDQPPSMAVEQPAATTFVTADAIVPVRINVKDDLAIHQVRLKFGRSDQTDKPDVTLPLFTGPDKVTPAKVGGLAGGSLGDARVVEYSWDLGPLGLKPGTQVTFTGVAGDYLPQEGHSSARRLTIITPQELEDRIAQRQAVILGELGRVLKMQQEARSQTTSLEIQMREVGRLSKQDVDHAQGAELNQRQVSRTLTSTSEGIPAQVADLLTDLKSNKVDSPDIERRMQSILGEIDRLGKQHLNAIERELTSAIKGAQSQLSESGQPPAEKTPEDAQVKNSLATAGKHQDEVVKTLETMLGELSQWDNYRRFARDIGQVRREQEEITKRTKDLGAKTLGKDLKELDQQQQADLKKLGALQQDLARRFDKVQQQMDDMEKQLQESDPLSAATIADALHQARQQGVSGQMRESGFQVEKNQIGQAAKGQEETAQNLQELLDILSNRRESELGRLVKKLKEAEQQLADLRRQQQGLRKKMDEAAKKTDPEERKRELERLSKEQRQLQAEAQRMARKLERLQADRAGRSTAGAAAKMSKAGASGEKGESENAEEQAAQAEKDLEEAQQQLAERRRQAEADLAQEQLAKIADAMKGLVQREQKVIEETGRLESLRDAKGQLTRAQDISVLDLARDQKQVQAETRALAEKIAAAEVFKLALDGANQDMSRAVARLERRDTGRQTQQIEQRVLARFKQLIEAMKPGEKKPGGEEKENGGEGGQQQGGQQDGIRAVAELKLLKLLQEDLNLRFEQLNDPDSPEPVEDRAQRLGELSQEQVRLADLAFKLSQPTDEKPEDDPAKLPDLRLEDKLPTPEEKK